MLANRRYGNSIGNRRSGRGPGPHGARRRRSPSRMASARFIDALNDQIAREFAAAHQYTAIGAHYDRETFPRLSAFFYDQAEEERGHALKMVNYLRDIGGELRLGEVGGARLDLKDPGSDPAP